MRLLDSRRLTGANLFLPQPGAVLDVAVEEAQRELLIAVWRHHARRLLHDMDWPIVLATRCFEGGVNLVIAAPVDGLYVATELNEAALDAARDWIDGSQRHLLARAARQLRADYRDEKRPRLQRLLETAKARGTPYLLDDESLTLGHGHCGMTWDLYELPHPDDVPWPTLQSIPVALITGTNGKTTTVRLLAAILREHGKTVGVCSTDWLAMGDELLSRDDYAGPAGARAVLRDQRCEVAVLETARGGLMRRGLAVSRADVGLITNISADHLGDYGIETVADLADVKFSITRALDRASTLVMNAEDPLLMSRYADAPCPVTLFGLSPKNPAMKQHLAANGVGFTLQRGRLVRLHQSKSESIVSERQIPVTYAGTAKHNTANALAAAAVASAMNIPLPAIAAGLCAFRNEDNPGRANLYVINGITVLLDFAHNPAGMSALMPVIAGLPAERRILVTGQAGDRSDADIIAFANATGDVRFDRIFLKQMDGHARGRPLGEVATLMRDAFLGAGYKSRAVTMIKTEIDATRAALRWARAGDLIVLLAHEKKHDTRALLEQLAEKSRNS